MPLSPPAPPPPSAANAQGLQAPRVRFRWWPKGLIPSTPPNQGCTRRKDACTGPAETGRPQLVEEAHTFHHAAPRQPTHLTGVDEQPTHRARCGALGGLHRRLGSRLAHVGPHPQAARCPNGYPMQSICSATHSATPSGPLAGPLRFTSQGTRLASLAAVTPFHPTIPFPPSGAMGRGCKQHFCQQSWHGRWDLGCRRQPRSCSFSITPLCGRASAAAEPRYHCQLRRPGSRGGRPFPWHTAAPCHDPFGFASRLGWRPHLRQAGQGMECGMCSQSGFPCLVLLQPTSSAVSSTLAGAAPE